MERALSRHCPFGAKAVGFLQRQVHVSRTCMLSPLAMVDQTTGSRSGARERRLQKVYEDRKRREQAKGRYPQWARILEDACKLDKELREVIGDSAGNAEEMKKRVEERILRKGQDFLHSSSGSAMPMKISFREFNATEAYIWLELYKPPSQKDMEVICGVFRSWYLLGRLGAFNSLNLQVSNTPADQALSYNEKDLDGVLPAYFHDVGTLEFQDNLGRLWMDLGTADALALDVFINSFSVVSSEYDFLLTRSDLLIKLDVFFILVCL
ncbi:hypothetical protein GOP47_0011052 [Adiantum capillus-veneris]|uniref:Uncharacterized protein n=1 Tax=Adiantum capillus-veneris TaxID=13818 RepID=A0A9D4US12_ADICA|nr:hypothetical protein GOP47_0011052 [Adiantum capillus-veneris]